MKSKKYTCRSACNSNTVQTSHKPLDGGVGEIKITHKNNSMHVYEGDRCVEIINYKDTTTEDAIAKVKAYLIKRWVA